MESMHNLEKLFDAYARGEPGIDARTYVKMFKDAQATSKALSPNELDLVYLKSKPIKTMKMTFDEFVKSLELCAQIKLSSVKILIDELLRSKGPKFSGTKTEFVKLYDDKSTYTGVYAKGGPKIIDDGPKVITDLPKWEGIKENERRTGNGLIRQ